MKLKKIDPILVSKEAKTWIPCPVLSSIACSSANSRDNGMFFSLKDNPVLLKKFSELANVFHKPSLKAALIRNIDHGEW